MAFNWQPNGAFQGAVPNQLMGQTPVPQNNVGLGLPGGGALFNLQISRQASSDPIQNMINDIGNPLGGLNVSFGGGGPAGAPATPNKPAGGLKDSMVGVGGAPMNEMNMGGPAPNFQNFGNPQSAAMEGFGIGTPGFENLAKSQFALKQRMISPSLMGATFA